MAAGPEVDLDDLRRAVAQQMCMCHPADDDSAHCANMEAVERIVTKVIVPALDAVVQAAYSRAADEAWLRGRHGYI